MSPTILTPCVVFKSLLKVNNSPIREISPNLSTLMPAMLTFGQQGITQGLRKNTQGLRKINPEQFIRNDFSKKLETRYRSRMDR
jgi:hypothetical protein